MIGCECGEDEAATGGMIGDGEDGGGGFDDAGEHRRMSVVSRRLSVADQFRRVGMRRRGKPAADRTRRADQNLYPAVQLGNSGSFVFLDQLLSPTSNRYLRIFL